MPELRHAAWRAVITATLASVRAVVTVADRRERATMFQSLIVLGALLAIVGCSVSPTAPSPSPIPSPQRESLSVAPVDTVWKTVCYPLDTDPPTTYCVRTPRY